MATTARPMSRMRTMEAAIQQKEALFRSRKRILKYLVLSFLKQEGCARAAESLVAEAGLTGEYELCDNIDLDIILQDYVSYYLMRFNKQPQFCRKVDDAPPARRPPTRRCKPAAVEVVEPSGAGAGADLPSTLAVTRLGPQGDEDLDSSPANETKPLSVFLRNSSPEKREIAEMLYQDIIRPSGVSWDDVKGLDDAKRLLMEAVVYPLKYPEVFTGLLAPWRGVLLHGAPGTGKTLLARALAADARCTLFNVACSSLVSKWRGDSEKIVRVLFQMASYYSPSVIFIDEVETISSERSSPGEHEASRRLKAQLLTELDGIKGRDGAVFLLATSNMPWEIDSAMLRRLEKRIHIPLPDANTRAELFKSFLGPNIEVVPGVDFGLFTSNTDGYSGSDIKVVCKEAMMASVRRMLPDLEAKGRLPKRQKLPLTDICDSLTKTKPVCKNLAQKHVDWQAEFGCS